MTKEKKELQPGKAGLKTPILSFNASYIAYAHTIFAYSAFFAALIVGCYLHYEKIVENSSWGYPDEWFPSVSATIGDRYPERSVFQILIALTAGPRFLLLAFNFIKLYKSNSSLPYIGIFSGFIRTITCGGWVYITSTDDHDWHDIFMISYIVLTIPWTIIISKLSPPGSLVRRGRYLTASTFFLTLIPLIYWFIQHKVHDRAGAYSVYAYFEWSLIILDVAFDTWSIVDFKDLEIQIFGDGFTLANKAKPPTEKTNDLDEYSTFEFIVNTINSFFLWTVITSLLLCVWYFPLWHMGLSGYEATILIFVIAPFILIIPFIRNFFSRFQFLARSLTILLGLGSYKVEDPESRLLIITAGTGFGIIALITEIWTLSNQPKKLNAFAVSFLLGLLASSIIKYSSYSNNPFWPVMHKENGGLNEIGIFLGLFAAFFTPSLNSTTFKLSTERSGGSIFLSALGFGAYLFSIQFLISDSSTLIFWAWDGYPVTGPTPITGALINFFAIGLGITLSVKVHSNAFLGPTYNLLAGAVSAYILYSYKGWLGYAGSTVYSFYLSTLAPLIWQSTVGYNPSLLFTLAFFYSIVFSLASVWIVAYAFVPGGPLLRERTDLVLGSSFVGILAGILNYNLRNRSSHITRINTIGKKLFKQTFAILTVFLAFSIAVFFKRYPTKPYHPYNSSSQSFTAGIWCVHFGLDNDMWSSEHRMKDLIKEAEVDIIGLLESDTQRLIGGNRDFTQTIAEELGMYADYGPGPNQHTWGAALLSKFPIISSSHHLLPSPVGELAPAIHATLDIYGELVDVVVFHSGQEEDEEDRRLQSLELQRIMGESERPLVLLSYLVTNPYEGNYNTYVSDKSRMRDIDSNDWDRWCEYILFRDLKKVAYARISRSTITDTELQIAKFKLLEEYQIEEGNDFIYGNHYIDEDEVDESLRMPQLFRGDGVRGHRYHVFDEPRYFAERPSQVRNDD